jgi:hypothetical protein
MAETRICVVSDGRVTGYEGHEVADKLDIAGSSPTGSGHALTAQFTQWGFSVNPEFLPATWAFAVTYPSCAS